MEELNQAQLDILAGCVVTSTVLSVAGSLCTTVWTVRKLRSKPTSSIRDNERNKTFDRLVLCLGIFDIISSIAAALVQFTYPRNDSQSVKGCVSQGLISIFGAVGVSLTNGALSLYFVLAICRRWQDHDFNWLERCWYLGIVLVPSLLLFIGIGTRSAAPLHYAPTCWFGGEWPEGCQSDETVEADCGYGGDISEVMSFITTGIMAFVSIFSILNMVVVWRSYRKTIQQSQRHLFRGDDMNSADKRLRRITIQSLFYSAIYVNMVFWLGVATVVSQSRSKKMPFLLICTGMFVFIAQGFFNAIAYCWPAIQEWREERRKASQRTLATGASAGVVIDQPSDIDLQVREESESSPHPISILFDGSSSISVNQ